MVESEVSLITEDDQYAYSENQTVSKGLINIESKEQSCYIISGVIAYVGANEALNMVASGYRVGVTFNIPDGISADGSGYIKSALASDENASFSAMTEVAKIEENQNSVTIYVTFNGFKNICKLELQWNALQTPETIYLKLADNINAEIRADATIIASVALFSRIAIANLPEFEVISSSVPIIIPPDSSPAKRSLGLMPRLIELPNTSSITTSPVRAFLSFNSTFFIIFAISLKPTGTLTTFTA